VNGIQQILIAEWLGEEFNGARFLSAHRHGDIAVARDKNDRNVHVGRSQLALKIEPAFPPGNLTSSIRQLGAVRSLPLQKFARRAEELDSEAHRADQAF
jgi:hypothetical protein